jgi:hypothetical protein
LNAFILKKNSRGKKVKKKKIIYLFLKAFCKGKKKYTLTKKFNSTSNEKKIYHHPILYNIKKFTFIYFLFTI